MPGMTRRWTYRTIAADVEQKIEHREYPPGARIPSYKQLSLLYGVSVATAHGIAFAQRSVPNSASPVAVSAARPQ